MGQCPADLPLLSTYEMGQATLKLSGCIPLNVAIQNKVPGATNVRTVFDYTGGAVSPQSLSTDSVHVYQRPGVYTILQYSDTPGKKWVACRTVEVQDTIAPVVKAIPCADGGAQLTFADKQPTTYPTYQIDWGDTEIKGYTGYGNKIRYKYDTAGTYTIRVRGVYTPGQCRGSIRQITFKMPKTMEPPVVTEARALSTTQLSLSIENPLQTDLLLLSGKSNSIFESRGLPVSSTQTTITAVVSDGGPTCFRLQPTDSCLIPLSSKPVCISEFGLVGRPDLNTLSWKTPYSPPGLTAVIHKDGVFWKDITALGAMATTSDREFVCGNEVCYQLIVKYYDFTYYSLPQCNQIPLDECVARPPFYMPEAFSPNGDGINDELDVKGVISSDFQLSIFNTWGTLLFHTADPSVRWDGRASGDDAPTGTYAFLVKYRDVSGNYQTSGGRIFLIR